ncbi:MAG: branched-chain amino acid ABC transporter permease, partial [Actinomycetota bacterium]|nr:branched-chain amino acid ABC transporter permease [Actinomycetota bacterium]
MHALIQAIILGILTGGVYALMASGQTLIFGIMKVVNLAQGALVVLGAYLTYTLFTQLGIDPFLSVLITTPLLFFVG